MWLILFEMLIFFLISFFFFLVSNERLTAPEAS